MEFLKKLLIIIAIVISNQVSAQDKTILNAFSQSYNFEAVQNYPSAIDAITKVYNPASYEMNMRLGWLNYSMTKYKESLPFYEKAIGNMPAATEPRWAIINSLSVLEIWNDVEKNYLSILKLDPKNSVANYKLGMIYYYRKNYVSAKKNFDVSLNLFPFDYNNLLMSAWTNYFLGNKNEARLLFTKVLYYSPNDASALEGLEAIK